MCVYFLDSLPSQHSYVYKVGDLSNFTAKPFGSTISTSSLMNRKSVLSSSSLLNTSTSSESSHNASTTSKDVQPAPQEIFITSAPENKLSNSQSFSTKKDISDDSSSKLSSTNTNCPLNKPLYASKSMIASTYTQSMNRSSLHTYQRNITDIYKDLPNAAKKAASK